MSELYKPKQGTRNFCARNTYSPSKIDWAKTTAFGHFGLDLACSNSICLLIDQLDWDKRGPSCRHLLLTSFLLMLILLFCLPSLVKYLICTQQVLVRLRDFKCRACGPQKGRIINRSYSAPVWYSALGPQQNIPGSVKKWKVPGKTL